MLRTECGCDVSVQNVVSTTDLRTRVDLKHVALSARNTEYNPRRFAALIMRIREPKTTALVFGSGKIVCTGAKTEEDSRIAVRKYVGILERLGTVPESKGEFHIQNIVGSTDVGFPVRVEGVVSAHRLYATYEPDLFPGMIYRMLRPKVVLLVFVSGKIVITGSKSKEDVACAIEQIYPVLLEHRKS